MAGLANAPKTTGSNPLINPSTGKSYAEENAYNLDTGKRVGGGVEIIGKSSIENAAVAVASLKERDNLLNKLGGTTDVKKVAG